MPELPVHQALASRRRSARRGMIWLMLLAAAECAPGAAQAAIPADDPARSVGQRGDEGVGDLLRRVEQQVSAGQFVSPQDDSAMETWGQVVRLERSSPNSVPIHEEIADFAAKIRHRAAVEEDAGRLSRSIDFVLFADLAGQLLGEAPAAAQTAAPIPQASVSPSNTPRPDSTPAGNLASPVREASAATASDAVQAARPVAAAPAVIPSVATSPPLPAASPKEPSPAAAPALPSPEANFYMARGDDMLAKKDVSAARKYYQFAAQAGSARAALALGQSYDPEFLARLGAIGLKPDMAQAKSWYRTASTLGNQQAAARLRAIILEASQ